MDETEWLSCGDPARLLAARWELGEFAGQRKLRLFAAACLRRTWTRLANPRCQTAIEVYEQFAEGEAGQQELTAAIGNVDAAIAAASPDEEESQLHAMHAIRAALIGCPIGVVAGHAARSAGEGVNWGEQVAAERVHQAGVFRDIFQNPFRPIAIDHSWLGDDGVELVRLAARPEPLTGLLSQAPCMMLADWMAARGCHEMSVLAHLWSGRGHVRGCWLIDLLLGRE